MNIILEQYKISISNNVLEIFNKFKQDGWKKKESGGIIFCQISEVDKSINLIKISTPNKFDSSSRTSFVRDKDAAQILVDFEFINSQGKNIYIGEWHTHPENYPRPSSQDITMIKQQFKSSFLCEKFILLLIIGIKGIYLAVYDGTTIEEYSTNF